MELLTGLLAHYRQLIGNKQTEINLITETIKTKTGLTFLGQDFKLEKGLLFIKTRPKYKLEIILRKKEIIDCLGEQGIKIFDFR